MWICCKIKWGNKSGDGAWKPRYSMPSLSHFLMLRFPSRKQSPWVHWESLKAWIQVLHWGRLREGTWKSVGYLQVYSTSWDSSMRAHQTGWYHWDRTLKYNLWKIAVIRRSYEWKEIQCHSCFQEQGAGPGDLQAEQLTSVPGKVWEHIIVEDILVRTRWLGIVSAKEGRGKSCPGIL